MSVEMQNGEIARGVLRCDGCGKVWWIRNLRRNPKTKVVLCPDCREEAWSSRAKVKAARASKGKQNIQITGEP